MTYNTWFLPIKPLELENKTLKVQLPSQFFWEWIDEHFNTLITKTIHQVLGPDAKLAYIINEEEVNHPPITSAKPEVVTKVQEKVKQKNFDSHLNPRYTFENFIKGEGNQLARAAAMAISDNPGGTSFNPLFIYGGVGLGKTHLIQAAGNRILESNSDKKVIYLSSDTFTVDFVEAIQSNRVNEFSNLYRSMDVLIIDDIQFLIGKELKGLDDRLISRFQWGLSADIQPPELETRIAILKRKAIDYGMEISSEILEYIASNITSNIRELEGCLIKLLANASLNSVEIDFELARKIVKEIATDRKVNVTVENITKIVCSYLNIAENKIRDKSRKKEIVLARQLAMYLSKELTKSSLKSIGLQFGGRDHSTVIHACNAIENAIATDPNMRDIVNSLRTQIEMVSS